VPHSPALELKGLCVEAGSQPCVTDVSLAVAPGEFHGLLGPNGAGKTTLLRTLYFSNTPTTGTVELMGREQSDWNRADWSRTLGVLVQGSGMLAGLTVRDIIDIGLQDLPISEAERAVLRDEATAIAGLEDASSQLAETLSGGELQRCYFAQVLARNPDVYVLDEPTNHLDLHYQLVLLDEIKRRGKTVLATLHDLSIAARYCDRVTLLDSGRVVATGSVEQVLTREHLAQVYRVDGALIDGTLRLDRPI
jgi:iron complex transport system ATP-binding protein